MKKAINAPAIQTALTENGMTQKELAKTVGVSSQAITNWLKGKDFPRPPKLLKLATSLKLTFEQLIAHPDEGAPIIAFRKKGNAKTTATHIERAKGIGMLLKPLLPYLPELNALRTLITLPSTDYQKLQIAVSQTRKQLGIGERATLDYQHLISEFKDCGAILIPVLWGTKTRHENALHIRLPKDDVTFIYLNLDTYLEDFKFWMAHELAHIYTPELSGSDEGEDFADAFAGALLFPQACAKLAYEEAIKRIGDEKRIKALLKHADTHMISLNTVYQQVKLFASKNGLTSLDINERLLHAVRSNNQRHLVSDKLFVPMPPEPDRYIATCEHVFNSEFFNSLRLMINESGTGAAYIQQILDVPLLL